MSTYQKPEEEKILSRHSATEDDAKELEAMLKDKGVKDVVINYIGPVIGAHSGPGTVAVFCMGRDRLV